MQNNSGKGKQFFRGSDYYCLANPTADKTAYGAALDLETELRASGFAVSLRQRRDGVEVRWCRPVQVSNLRVRPYRRPDGVTFNSAGQEVR